MEWPSEKIQADAYGFAAPLHQLARHIVDRRDMVGVEGVPQAETISQRGGAHENGEIVERHNRPGPSSNVADHEQGDDRSRAFADIVAFVDEQAGENGAHSTPLRAQAV